MSAARFIVCEKHGHWAAALRVALDRAGIEQRVYETRSLADCWDSLNSHPASFLALEAVSEGLLRVLDQLSSLSRQYPGARAMVVTSSDQRPHQWRLREAGAVHVAFSPLQLLSAVRLAHRHLQRAPQVEIGLREAIWTRIPWQIAR